MARHKDWTHYENARFAALDRRPISDEAWKFADLVVERVRRREQRKYQRGPKANAELRQLAGSFAADLLDAARKDVKRWSYRSLRANDYSGTDVPYRMFKLAFETFEAEQWIDVLPGYYERKNTWSDLPFEPSGKATRFRANDAFIALAAQDGLTPDNLSDHFETMLPKIVLELRMRSEGWRNWERGRRVRFDANKITEELQRRVRWVNEFMAKQTIEGGIHRGFRRIFTLIGDKASYAWNKHGRLYSIGEDNYQTLKPEERLKMKLNGEAVVEIDIRASHLTILHAVLREPFDTSNDPYRMPWPERSIAKQWITMTLGYSKMHQRWPREIAKEYFEDEGCKLQDKYPITKVKEAIVARFPILRRLGEPGTSGFDFMFMESEAIEGSVMELAQRHAIPALPVHDSIIVPRSGQEIAQLVLKEHYQRVVGVEPALKVEGLDGRAVAAVAPKAAAVG